MGLFFRFRLKSYDDEYYRIYDKAQEIDLGRIPSFRLLRALLAPARGERILDAGCGAGHQLAFFLEGSEAKGLGVDFSAAALGLAKRLRPGLQTARQDLRALGLAEASQDKIVCFNVIEHIAEQDAVMREFARVLKPGGLLVIGTNIRDSIAWKLYQLFIGEHTHVREFSVAEFTGFVGGFFDVESVRKSSGVFRFGPPLSWLFHHVLLGDVIVAARKRGQTP